MSFQPLGVTLGACLEEMDEFLANAPSRECEW